VGLTCRLAKMGLASDRLFTKSAPKSGTQA
jgi:hypothetical protein